MTKHFNENYDRQRFTIYGANSKSKTIMLGGCLRWALETLVASGDKGCTPYEGPPKRWACHIKRLRILGVQIDTRQGVNARNRYVLTSKVEWVNRHEVAA